MASSGEFGHISEFYETLLLLVIFALACFEILSFIFNFSLKERHLKQMINEYFAYQKWVGQKTQSVQNPPQPQTNPQQEPQIDLQKSVAYYVENEITNMEKTHEQPNTTQPSTVPPPILPMPPIQPPPEQQPELTNNKKTLLSVYVAYNNFINEKLAILVPLLIVGILTKSTYVYTLVAFFCSFMCDLLVEVLENEEKAHNIENSGKFGLKQGVKLLGNAFILSIFFTYWSVTQFNAS